MFLHTFRPTAEILSLGPVTIYWYGVLMVVGILSGILVTARLARRHGISLETIIDLSFWLCIGGIIGARLYHVLLELPYYLNHPLNILKTWQGGLAIHGAIIAGLLVIRHYCRRHQLSFLQLASLIVPGLALGQAIGRWGNYFNQELFGLPTSLPWGIPIAATNRPLAYYNEIYFHPTFLYESLGNLALFGLLIGLHLWIRRQPDNKRPIWLEGLPAIVYLIGYSLLRFGLEFIRIDSTPVVGPLRWPQVASLVIIIGCLAWLLPKIKKYANNNRSSQLPA